MNIFQRIPCGAVLRSYLMLNALSLVLLSFLEPRSLTGYIASRSGALGETLMVVMAIIGLIGIADIIINDFLPARITWHWPLDCRHCIYMSMAMCYAIQMFHAVHVVGSWSAFPYYFLHASFLVVAAFIDVVVRFKRKGARCVADFS
jgi:uncharacterized membrane protein (DUF4010 family)